MPALFIDSNVFFYAKIMDRDYGEACARVIRRVEAGEIEATTSVLIVVELANALRKYGLSDEVKKVVDAVFSLDISILQVDPTDVRVAADIFDKSRISPYDCVHIAVMKRAAIKEIISADREFDRVTDIKRLDPHRL